MPTPGGERPTFGPPPARSVSSQARQSRVGVGGGAQGALGSPQKSGVEPLCAAGLACRHSESTRLCPNPIPQTQAPPPRHDSVSPRLLAGPEGADLPGRGSAGGGGCGRRSVGSGPGLQEAAALRGLRTAPARAQARALAGRGRKRRHRPAPPRPARWGPRGELAWARGGARGGGRGAGSAHSDGRFQGISPRL